MNPQYKVCLMTKTTNFEKLKVFIDNKSVNGNGSKYIWYGDIGNHSIRIEQDKMIKSKYYWMLCPIVFLLSLLTGDGELDGRTPFYAVYEAEIYVDKDIEINVLLYDVNRNMKKSKRYIYYKFEVDFPRGLELKVIRNEITAKPKERKRWFLYNSALWSVIFAALIGFSIFTGINSYKDGNGLIGMILCWGLAFLFTAGWIAIVYRYYRSSNAELKEDY